MKIYRTISLLALVLLLPLGMWSQNNSEFIKGKVFDATDNLELIGVMVYWEGSDTGILTDDNGEYRLTKSPEYKNIIFRALGYQTDTIAASGLKVLNQGMTPGTELDVVEINSRQKTSEISMLDPMKTENIGERELTKAACCNLAESFETSPSVDVSFTDAVTGTRQIQMLGLAGPYVQVMRENMPHIRGIAAIQGMGFVPGTWVENIQLNKGTGSVTNGYEGFAGQINVCLRQPENMDRFFLNMYTNAMGRTELNSHIGAKVSDKLSTALLLHGRLGLIRNDRNNDGFLDNPLDRRFIALNRWKYIGKGGVRFQAGAKATVVDAIGGQMDYDPETDRGTTNSWGMQQTIRRGEGWGKIGRVYDDKPWKTVGLQFSGMHHDQKSDFGLTSYDAQQSTLYGNLIYQTILGNTNHKIKTGASFMYDDYKETLNQNQFARTEIVPGAYVEYTFSQTEKIDVVAGLRADYHNIFGAFVTPRLHVRYAFAENTVIRGSVGRGQRTANIIAENMGLLASSRAIVIRSEDSDLPYGLDQEVAWNFGLNLTQKFTLDYREGVFSMDYYRTDFQNQIVIDLDANPQEAIFYNLDGESFSNSFQAQLDYELIKRLDVRLAYRWYDVKTTYGGELRQKPLLATHRAFINLAYGTSSNWKFDATLNWESSKRIPITSSNPVEFQLAERSPSFFALNGQVSKTWREKFEVYAGVENLLNFRQEAPILSVAQPFSPYFDSSMIWGPIFGRNIYLGLRYNLK